MIITILAVFLHGKLFIDISFSRVQTNACNNNRTNVNCHMTAYCNYCVLHYLLNCLHSTNHQLMHGHTSNVHLHNVNHLLFYYNFSMDMALDLL